MIRKWSLRLLALLAAIVIAMLVYVDQGAPTSDPRGNTVNDPIEVEESRFSDDWIGKYVKFAVVCEESSSPGEDLCFYTLRDGMPYARCVRADFSSSAGTIKGRRCAVVGKYTGMLKIQLSCVMQPRDGDWPPIRLNTADTRAVCVEDGRILE